MTCFTKLIMLLLIVAISYTNFALSISFNNSSNTTVNPHNQKKKPTFKPVYKYPTSKPVYKYPTIKPVKKTPSMKPEIMKTNKPVYKYPSKKPTSSKPLYRYPSKKPFSSKPVYKYPTKIPALTSIVPSGIPSIIPTMPTFKPSKKPTQTPSLSPSYKPSHPTGNSFLTTQTLSNVTAVTLNTTNGILALKQAILKSLNDSAMTLDQIAILNVTTNQNGNGVKTYYRVFFNSVAPKVTYDKLTTSLSVSQTHYEHLHNN